MPEVIFTGPQAALRAVIIPPSRKTRRSPWCCIRTAVSRHDEPPDHLPVLLRIRASRHFGATLHFRGVGRSQGSFDHGTGELSDAASALDWAQTINPEARACWVAGFSFGAWIGMQLLMRRPEVEVSFRSHRPPTSMTSRSWRPAHPRADRAWRQGRRGAAQGRQHAGRETQTQKGIVIDQQSSPAPTISSTESCSP